MSRVLIVEDDPAILRGLADNVRFEAHEVFTATDRRDRLSSRPRQESGCDRPRLDAPTHEWLRSVPQAAGRGRPDANLDADRPRWRKRIAFSGSTSAPTIYVNKLFSVRELLARIRAVLRRAHPLKTMPDELRFADVVIDFRKYEAKKGDRVVDLTRKEFGILRFLAARAGDVVTRDDLLNEVWGYESSPTTRTVDTHVASLRRRSWTMPTSRAWTVHGVGYRWVG